MHYADGVYVTLTNTAASRTDGTVGWELASERRASALSSERHLPPVFSYPPCRCKSEHKPVHWRVGCRWDRAMWLASKLNAGHTSRPFYLAWPCSALAFLPWLESRMWVSSLSLWRVRHLRNLVPGEEMTSRTSWPYHQEAWVRAPGLLVTAPVTSCGSLHLSMHGLASLSGGWDGGLGAGASGC